MFYLFKKNEFRKWRNVFVNEKYHFEWPNNIIMMIEWSRLNMFEMMFEIQTVFTNCDTGYIPDSSTITSRSDIESAWLIRTSID